MHTYSNTDCTTEQQQHPSIPSINQSIMPSTTTFANKSSYVASRRKTARRNNSKSSEVKSYLDNIIENGIDVSKISDHTATTVPFNDSSMSSTSFAYDHNSSTSFAYDHNANEEEKRAEEEEENKTEVKEEKEQLGFPRWVWNIGVVDDENDENDDLEEDVWRKRKISRAAASSEESKIKVGGSKAKAGLKERSYLRSPRKKEEISLSKVLEVVDHVIENGIDSSKVVPSPTKTSKPTIGKRVKAKSFYVDRINNDAEKTSKAKSFNVERIDNDAVNPSMVKATSRKVPKTSKVVPSPTKTSKPTTGRRVKAKSFNIDSIDNDTAKPSFVRATSWKVPKTRGNVNIDSVANKEQLNKASGISSIPKELDTTAGVKGLAKQFDVLRISKMAAKSA